MIQSLSDKNKKKNVRYRRIVLIGSTAVLLGSWFFLKPLFLTVFDPILSLYFGARSTLYITAEKTKTFFISKEKSLLYIKELEAENSRLHSALARAEYNPCATVVTPFITTATSSFTLGTATTTENVQNEKIEGASTKQLFNPCVLVEQSKQEQEVTVMVSPVTSPLASLYETFRINKGENEGIVIDDIVYTRGRIAVGKVVSVTRNTALVRLFSKDSAENLGTLIGGQASFKVIGNGAGTFKAKVPKDIPVSEGDAVLLTENQELSLGTVSLISFEKEDVAKVLYIKGGFNYSAMGVLYVTLQ